MKCFEHGKPLPIHSQIGEEIAYFWDYYETLHPTVFLTYEREAYYALDGSDFRVTFDEISFIGRKIFHLEVRYMAHRY